MEAYIYLSNGIPTSLKNHSATLPNLGFKNGKSGRESNVCTLKVPFQNAVKELWQFVPERDYSNSECTLVATGFTLLLVNLQSISTMRVGAAKTTSHGKSRRPCIVLYMQIRSPRILPRAGENSCSHWRAVSYESWCNPFTNFSPSY